ncbi:MFS transporter [Geminicoccus flavidas]|uniref:MFS transporter n=1 Tax=Geminicoccus flavidas TaxID=2506407 RepID=UPI001F2FEFF3|nr:MFS transporter [Geminicoccus flavidas]
MRPETVAATQPAATGSRRRAVVVSALGITQILAWGSSYYLLAVLAQPIQEDTGWPIAWIVGGLSLGLLIAGLVSPKVGRVIEDRGGRPVLALSSVLLAVGLLALALAPTLPVYVMAWVIMGLGMGAGLYDAAFATLGRLYGQSARQTITALTLFGGFASTACWPLSAFLVAELGWRGACLVYAAIQLCLALPIHLLLLPRPDRRDPVLPDAAGASPGAAHSPRPARFAFLVLAAIITIGSVVSATMSVHLFTILQAYGIGLSSAVAFGALVGPAQVAARAVEMAIGRHHHPIWTMAASTACVTLGLGALWAGFPFVAPTLLFYGVGIGLASIARGTLPLGLFGAQGYAAMMGRLAMPSLIAQAITPSLGAVLADGIGADGLLGVLVGLAGFNVILLAGLWAGAVRTRPG